MCGLNASWVFTLLRWLIGAMALVVVGCSGTHPQPVPSGAGQASSLTAPSAGSDIGTSPNNVVPPQTAVPEVHPHHHAVAATPEATPTASPASSPSPSAVPTPSALPTPSTTLSLGNNNSSKSQAEQLLGAADSKLAGVDRSKLNGSDAATYDQATGFVTAARQAMAQQDYVAASGFAQKASLLADKVAAGAGN